MSESVDRVLRDLVCELVGRAQSLERMAATTQNVHHRDCISAEGRGIDIALTVIRRRLRD